MTKTHRARRVAVRLLATLPLALSAAAQAPAVDRLQHPADTVTGPAGIARVERRGRGPVPLLLIAGAPFGASAFADFMARNEERYTMFAVTPAGYAGTPPPAMPEEDDADYSERAWTEALMAGLAALLRDEIAGKHGPAVVLGHHLMGDYYAVRLAAEHPELVLGVVSAAGLGSAPVRNEMSADDDPAEVRASYVRDSRAPFFRTVSQATWNANTFKPSMLSVDAERGQELYEEEVAVPIATQVRYYLEYMTDQIEPYIERVGVPVLSLEFPASKGGMDLDSLPQSMKDQLVKRFGSLEKAREQVQVARTPWQAVAGRARSGIVRSQQIEGSGAFMMQDVPEVFDRALADFAAELEPPPAKTGAGR